MNEAIVHMRVDQGHAQRTQWGRLLREGALALTAFVADQQFVMAAFRWSYQAHAKYHRDEVDEELTHCAITNEHDHAAPQ